MILTKDEKICRKAASLQKALSCLLPDRVQVRPVASLGGQGSCCADHQCFTTKWRRGAVQQCCMHIAAAGRSLHDKVRCHVAACVLHADPAASFFPECRIRVCKRDARGRFAAGPTHRCDLLVVLGGGSVIVFEVDDSSHSRGDAQRRDVVKDDWLDSRGVKCVRIPVKQCATKSGRCTQMQRVYKSVIDANAI